jgi:hypothetical protein
MLQLPSLTGQDVRRVYVLYSKSPEFLRGRMMHKPVKRAIVHDDLKLEEKKVVLHTDVMHIDGQRFANHYS